MKRDKVLPKYTTYELNELTKEHLGALLALYADAYHEGVKTGRRNALLFTGLGIVTASVWSYVVWFTYLKRKKQI